MTFDLARSARTSPAPATSALLRRGARTLLALATFALATFALATCTFDPALPPGAALTCDDDDDCGSTSTRTGTCIDGLCADPALATPALAFATDEDTAVDLVLDASLAVLVAREPTNGIVTIDDGNARYQPAPDFFGVDTFEYVRVGAAGRGSPGTVTITVAPVNDPPTITVLLDGDDGIARPVDTLPVPEAGELAFIVRVEDVEAVGGLLPRALNEGDVGYRLSFPFTTDDSSNCEELFRVNHAIADVFVATAEDDCFPTELIVTITALDADSAQVVLEVPLAVVPVNDPPVLSATYTCLDGNAPGQGAGCRGGVIVEADAVDIDSTSLCIGEITASWGTVVREDGEDPCSPTATIIADPGVNGAQTVFVNVFDDDDGYDELELDVLVTSADPDCAHIKARDATATSGVYEVDPLATATPFPVYCDMETAGGGFTLALKVNGSEQTFVYASSQWFTTTTLNGDSLDMSGVEAKLAAFSSVPVDEVLLFFNRSIGGLPPAPDPARAVLEGVRRDAVDVERPLAAASLQALLTRPPPEGAREAVSLETDIAMWTGALPNVGVECACNRFVINRAEDTGSFEGLRIGFIADDNVDLNVCNSPDSFVGVGSDRCFGNNRCSAGNQAAQNFGTDQCGRGNGDAWRPSFAWILVRATDFTDLPAHASCAAHASAGATLSGTYRLADGSDVECVF